MTNFVWESDQTVTINNIKFTLADGSPQSAQFQPTEDHFLLCKPRIYVERYDDFFKKYAKKKIIEIGVFKGGGLVFYDQVCHPEKIVAIEYNPKPIEGLTRYIQVNHKSDSVKVYYGTNQSDPVVMRQILANEFPNRDVDFVVDDASHRYFETKASFNFVFPYLKAGAHYIIEDWGWAHWSGRWQDPPHRLSRWKWWANKPPKGCLSLTNFLVELCMLSASRPDIIQNIFVDCGVIVVKRGNADLPLDFDISNYYLMRGKKFKPFL